MDGMHYFPRGLRSVTTVALGITIAAAGLCGTAHTVDRHDATPTRALAASSAAATAEPTSSTTGTPAADGADPDRVSTTCFKDLNEDTVATLDRIAKNGLDHRENYPYPKKDGSVFENRDDNPLPRHENGYYHEFTVIHDPNHLPKNRGTQRIVTGGDVSDKIEDYYTSDHYETFKLIDYSC